MITSNVTTITLDGEETAVEFEKGYPYYWITNKGSADIHVSLHPDITPKAEGVYTIAAGASERIGMGYPIKKFYITGTGEAYIRGEQIAAPPSFKRSEGGGDIIIDNRGYKIVAELPETGNSKYIYLVPKSSLLSEDTYNEYLWIEDKKKFELVGTTEIDLTDYAKKDEVVSGIKGSAETEYHQGNVNITKNNVGLSNVENKSSATIRSEITADNVTDALGFTPLGLVEPADLPIATNNSIGGVKPDGTTITVNGDGVISAATSEQYVLPEATESTLGGVMVDGSTITANDGVISVEDNSHSHTIANVTGLQNSLDGKASLSAIPTTLPANGGNADTVGGFTVGTNVPANAVFTDTVYTLPMASETVLGGVKVDGTTVTVNDNGVISATTGGGGSGGSNQHIEFFRLDIPFRVWTTIEFEKPFPNLTDINDVCILVYTYDNRAEATGDYIVTGHPTYTLNNSITLSMKIQAYEDHVRLWLNSNFPVNMIIADTRK